MGATAVVDTGHAAAFTLATTGGTWKPREIKVHDREIPTVDTTYLATTVMRTVMVGDLYDLTMVVIKVLFQGTQGLPTVGVSETVTITFPTPGGGAATPATLIGTGIIVKVVYPTLMTNELQMGEIHIKWDGTTPPAWTAAA